MSHWGTTSTNRGIDGSTLFTKQASHFFCKNEYFAEIFVNRWKKITVSSFNNIDFHICIDSVHASTLKLDSYTSKMWQKYKLFWNKWWNQKMLVLIVIKLLRFYFWNPLHSLENFHHICLVAYCKWHFLISYFKLIWIKKVLVSNISLCSTFWQRSIKAFHF